MEPWTIADAFNLHSFATAFFGYPFLLYTALFSHHDDLAWTRANRVASEKHISISSIASLLFILPVLGLIIVSFTLKETALLQPYFLVSLGGIVISSLLCQKATLILSFIIAFRKTS